LKNTKQYQYIAQLFSVIFIFLFIIKPVYAQEVSLYSWNDWLDNAYQLTWLDSEEINKWLLENEKKTFKEGLVSYADKWENKIIVAGQATQEKISYPEDDYRRLAIAEMLLYLQTSDQERLDKAFKIITNSILSNKLEIPEIAFWYYYISAHKNLKHGNSEAFVKDIYRIWFDVLLKLESAQYDLSISAPATTLRGFYKSLPYLYKNLANLILSRAIVQTHLPDMDAAGPVIWGLVPRMPNKGYGKWVEAVSKRIYGHESDNFRLSYTVLLMEGERQRRIAEDKIDSNAPFKSIEQSLTSALNYFKLTYNMAKTRNGQATSLTKYMGLASFVISRLHEMSDDQLRANIIKSLQFKDGIVIHEDEDILVKAMRTFGELATKTVRKNDWKNQGFLDRETYVAAMHNLWRAIMNLSLDTAIYFEKDIDPTKSQNFFYNMPIIKNILSRYLNMFQRYVKEGPLDILPDNAYFSTVEASELLSDLYFMAGQWENSISNYNKSYNLAFQAVEIFPFDINAYYKLTQRLSNHGRLDLYKKKVFGLINHIIDSDVIKETSKDEGIYMGETLHLLQELIPSVIAIAPSNIILQEGLDSLPKAASQRLKQLQDEIKTDFTTISTDNLSFNKIQMFIDKLDILEKVTLSSNEDILKIIDEFKSVIILIEGIINEIPEVSDTKEATERGVYPSPVKYLAAELMQIVDEAEILTRFPDMKNIRDALILDIEHPYHKLIRRFFHEKATKYIKISSRMIKNNFREKILSENNFPQNIPNEDKKILRRFKKLQDKDLSDDLYLD